MSIYTDFLPPAVSDFLVRWAHKTLAAVFVFGSLCLLLSLLSYYPEDPSFNVASSIDVSNLLGSFGASVADIFFQFFGVPSFLIAFVLAAWAWRYYISSPLQKLKKRASFLFVCLLSMGFFINLISVESQSVLFPVWSIRISLGGAFGALLKSFLVTKTAPFSYILFLKLVSFIISCASFIYVVGLKTEEWQRIASFIVGAAYLFFKLIKGFMSWILRYTASPSALRMKIKLPIQRKNNVPQRAATPMQAQQEAAQRNTPLSTPITAQTMQATANAQAIAQNQAATQAVTQAAATSTMTAPFPHETQPSYPPLSQQESPINRNDLSDGFDPNTVSPLMNMPSPLDEETTSSSTPPSSSSSSDSSPRKFFNKKVEQDSPPLNEEYFFPPVNYLKRGKASRVQISESKLSKQARLLEEVLQNFGVKGEVQGVHPGPIITLYEFDPEPGIKSSKIIGLSDDIARSMSAISVRVSVIPGNRALGIEIPNDIRETVFLRDIMDSNIFIKNENKLPLILGKDISGEVVVAELAKMPHLLIAGTTGSGKSVAVNTMILTLLYRLPPEKCRLIMIDPKMLELSVYQDIPHLLTPVVTDPNKAVFALKWAVREMENRYRAMSELGVRNIDSYNEKMQEIFESGEVPTRKIKAGYDPETAEPLFEEKPIDTDQLPYIVIFVDEMADLMLVAGKEIEANIQRLAQMARAAGIHIIMATQRPSVDVITGTIKANFPTRISFQVTSKIDSRTILGEQGAEQLLGRGDMLYMAPGERITRVHAPLVMDGEIEKIVTFIKQQGKPDYIEDITKNEEEIASAVVDDGGGDLYSQAVSIIKRERKASTSFIQRKLQIGYNRAANIIEQLEKEGVISEATHAGKREVLIPE